MLVDSEGNEVFDLGVLEPFCYRVKLGEREYPITRLTYASGFIKIEWRHTEGPIGPFTMDPCATL